MIMVALEDEETQKIGSVYVSYAIGRAVLKNSWVYQLSAIFRALPARVVSIHACVDDPKSQLLASAVTLLLPSHYRIRFRCHLGKAFSFFI
jgi:hypothetical protein